MTTEFDRAEHPSTKVYNEDLSSKKEIPKWLLKSGNTDNLFPVRISNSLTVFIKNKKDEKRTREKYKMYANDYRPTKQNQRTDTTGRTESTTDE